MTRFALVVGLLAVVGAAGCAQKKVGISGKITRGGQPLDADGKGLMVILIPENPGPEAKPYSAETDPAAGTYRVSGVPPGQYRFSVQQFDAEYKDALRGVYDPGATPLVRDVTHDGQVIDIDLPTELPPRKPILSGQKR